MTDKLIEITDENYESRVLKNRYYALVLFCSERTPDIEPIFQKLAKINPKNSKLFFTGIVDVDKFPQFVKGTKLKQLPHFVIYREGKIMQEFEYFYSVWDLKVYLGDELFKLLIKENE